VSEAASAVVGMQPDQPPTLLAPPAVVDHDRRGEERRKGAAKDH